MALRDSARVLAIALVALAATNGASSADPPCRLPRLAHADFVAQADGALMLPVTIGGQTEYFTLNGGARSFVYEADADRLDFGHHHYERDHGLFIAGKEVKSRRTVDLSVGRVRWLELEFYPLQTDRPSGTTAIGSLGMNFLASSQLDVEINTSANAINFIEPGICPKPTWAWSNEGNALDPVNGQTALPMQLDGRRFSGLFDTALAGTIMSQESFADRFGGIGGREPGEVQTFDSMTIGETAFAHPTIHVVSTNDDAVEDAVLRRARALNAFSVWPPHLFRESSRGAVWIGRSELSRMRIYFMFGAHKAFVTPILGAADTLSAPPEPDRNESETGQQR